MKKIEITAIILAKNEQEMLQGCLDTLSWCSDILVIDNGSTDKTREIAESYAAKVISFKHDSFARLRDEGLKRAKTDWIFYIDPDERVTPILAKEIMVTIETQAPSAISFLRENYFYGERFDFGGLQSDFVTRVFKKSDLKGWVGDIHESPDFSGEKIFLDTKLIHFTHRDLKTSLAKSSEWTIMEAEALANSERTGTVGFVTIFRKFTMEFLRRAFIKKGYKDGTKGLIESLIQAFNRAFVYIQVWELQQKPSIKEKYQIKQDEIISLWSKEK